MSELNERIEYQFDVWIFRTHWYCSWLIWGKNTTNLVSDVLWLENVFLYPLLDHFTCFNLSLFHLIIVFPPKICQNMTDNLHFNLAMYYNIPFCFLLCLPILTCFTPLHWVKDFYNPRLAFRCSKKLSPYLHWIGSSWIPEKNEGRLLCKKYIYYNLWQHFLIKFFINLDYGTLNVITLVGMLIQICFLVSTAMENYIMPSGNICL